MKILITETSYIIESQESPIIGHSYILENASEHTGKQRKAAHALIGEWFKSGAWDYDTRDYNRFRECVKRDYGGGFSHYEYVDDDYGMNRVKDLDNIPGYVLDDFNNGNKKRIKAILKSFTEYTKKDVMLLIDRLIDVMMERGVNSAKFQDIMEGLNEGD